MKPRTTLILVLVALVGAGIMILESRLGTPTDEAQIKQRRIVDIDPSKIASLEITSSNLTVYVEKIDDHWELKKPISVRANYSTITSILDQIEFAERDRTLTKKDLSTVSLTELGLIDPRVRITWKTGQQSVTLAIGNETPTKEAVYVKIDDHEEVHITSKTIFERLNRNLDDFRDRNILDILKSSITRVDIKSADHVIELTKSINPENAGSSWSIVQPLAARADQSKIDDMLGTLCGLRVVDFVSDEKRDLRMYSLQEPLREVTLYTGDKIQTLLLSSPLTNDSSKVYSKLKNADSIFTLSAVAAEKVPIQVNDLRDTRILNFSTNDLTKVELQRGTEKIVLHRESLSSDWVLIEPNAADVEQSVVGGLFTKLLGFKVKQFVADVATDLDKFGLATPMITVTLHWFKSNTVTQLLIGSLNESGSLRYVKLATEPSVYGVSVEETRALPISHVEFLNRQISNLDMEQISKLKFQTPIQTFLLERTEKKNWELINPAQGIVDLDHLKKLIATFSHLRANEIVSDNHEQLSKFGLTTPAVLIEGTLGDKIYRLQVGVRVDGGQQYAAWDDPTLVFTLSPADANIVLGDFVKLPEPPPLQTTNDIPSLMEQTVSTNNVTTPIKEVVPQVTPKNDSPIVAPDPQSGTP